MHLPGQVLRRHEETSGSVSARGIGGGQERHGGVVRSGPVDMCRGPRVFGRAGLLPHVLQADDPGGVVHGAVHKLAGHTAATGEGGQDESVPVRGQEFGRVSAQQRADGPAVFR